MSAQIIETARQNLMGQLAWLDAPRSAQIALAVEDLVRAYLVNHTEFAGHSAPIIATRLSNSSGDAL